MFSHLFFFNFDVFTELSMTTRSPLNLQQFSISMMSHQKTLDRRMDLLGPRRDTQLLLFPSQVILQSLRVHWPLHANSPITTRENIRFHILITKDQILDRAMDMLETVSQILLHLLHSMAIIIHRRQVLSITRRRKDH